MLGSREHPGQRYERSDEETEEERAHNPVHGIACRDRLARERVTGLPP
jgi:hypothetical protein